MSSDLVTLIALGEDPVPLLTTRLKTFLEAVDYAKTKRMKMHASISLFSFMLDHAALIIEHMPKLAKRAHTKAHEVIEEVKEGMVGECLEYELIDVCEDVFYYFGDHDEVVPSTPLTNSNAAEVPDAPKKVVKREETHVEQEGNEVAKQLFFPKAGEIYRSLFASDSAPSTVKCLKDGTLLELRRGEKTGKALDAAHRKIFQTWDEWQDVLRRF